MSGDGRVHEQDKVEAEISAFAGSSLKPSNTNNTDTTASVYRDEVRMNEEGDEDAPAEYLRLYGNANISGVEDDEGQGSELCFSFDEHNADDETDPTEYEIDGSELESDSDSLVSSLSDEGSEADTSEVSSLSDWTSRSSESSVTESEMSTDVAEGNGSDMEDETSESECESGRVYPAALHPSAAGYRQPPLYRLPQEENHNLEDEASVPAVEYEREYPAALHPSAAGYRQPPLYGPSLDYPPPSQTVQRWISLMRSQVLPMHCSQRASVDDLDEEDALLDGTDEAYGYEYHGSDDDDWTDEEST
jgi:hypothetical protein